MSNFAADNAAYHNFSKKSFWAQFFTMAQGAFNDNVLKFVILFFLIDQTKAQDVFLLGYKLDEYSINSLGTIVFSLPFVLFAGAVGAISDRYSKRSVAIYTKMLEFAIATLMFFAFSGNNLWFLLGVIFLMATHSAIYGPTKYGMLPETLPESRLSWANGVFAMGTLVAVILGTGLAGPLHDKLGTDVHYAAIVLMAFSLLGLISASLIQKLPAANPTQRIPLNPWGGLERYLSAIWRDKHLLHVFAGYVYFWFAGVIMQQTITVLVQQLPGLEDHARATFNSVCLVSVALGIGSGSFFAGIASRRKIELGIVPIGIFGMSLFGIALAIFSQSLPLLIVLIFGMGFFAGFFDVPLAATVQKRAPVALRGGIMAG